MYFCNVHHSLHLKCDFFFKIIVYSANVSIKNTDISVELVSGILVKWQILFSLVYGKFISMYIDFARKLPQFIRGKIFNPLSCFDLLFIATVASGKIRKMKINTYCIPTMCQAPCYTFLYIFQDRSARWV